jgi:hypothetical protein
VCFLKEQMSPYPVAFVPAQGSEVEPGSHVDFAVSFLVEQTSFFHFAQMMAKESEFGRGVHFALAVRFLVEQTSPSATSPSDWHRDLGFNVASTWPL